MPLLAIQDLRKSYTTPEGETHVVLDIPHFAMDEGEEVGLRGRSGSGKTTLLNAIAGLLRPDAGSIHIAGTDVAGLSESARDRFRADHIGYVFQTFNLLQGYTALENVVLGMSFGPGPDYDLAASLLRELGMGDRLDYRPGQLSIGQQQRVALARALANRPQLVLADEPTGNLDARTAGEALGLIRKACAEHGAALLLVSHDVDILAHFERVEALDEINRAAEASA
jgi:putative ABC transport system ATP-binding protein